MKNNPEKLYETFARHILIDLDGLAIIEVIQDMNQSGEQITLERLRKRINERGLNFPTGGTHFSSFKGWLSLAGVFDKDSISYKIHKDVVERIIGISEKTLPTKVLFPLRDTGLIDVEKSTSGRGAKPYLVRPTDKFQADILLSFPWLKRFR